MNELALFAGAGGGLLGTKLLGWQTICYVEKDPYCVEVLKSRIKEGYLHDAPIWSDAATFDGTPWAGSVDIVSAGFPCQPFSCAGEMRAALDKRNLWPETVRIISEVRPTWCLLENVPGLLAGNHGYFAQVLRGLAELGFDARWGCIPAAAIGAPHHRNRLWIVAYACGLDDHQTQPQEPGDTSDRWKPEVPSSGSHNLSGGLPGPNAWFLSEPGVDRVGDGVARRMDRVRAVGNGQVPAVVEAAWQMLTAPITSEPTLEVRISAKE